MCLVFVSGCAKVILSPIYLKKFHLLFSHNLKTQFQCYFLSDFRSFHIILLQIYTRSRQNLFAPPDLLPALPRIKVNQIRQHKLKSFRKLSHVPASVCHCEFMKKVHGRWILLLAADFSYLHRGFKTAPTQKMLRVEAGRLSHFQRWQCNKINQSIDRYFPLQIAKNTYITQSISTHPERR